MLPREWLQFPLTNHCSISVWTRKMGNWLQKHVARKIPHQNDKQHFMFYDISHIIMSCFWPFPYKLCILFDAYTQLENIQNEIDHIRFEMYRILTTSLEDWSEMQKYICVNKNHNFFFHPSSLLWQSIYRVYRLKVYEWKAFIVHSAIGPERADIFVASGWLVLLNGNYTARYPIPHRNLKLGISNQFPFPSLPIPY